MLAGDKHQHLLFRHVCESRKSIVIPKRPHTLIIPDDRDLVKDFKLEMSGSETFAGITSKLRVHLTLPLSESVFNIICGLYGQGERKVAWIRFDTIENVWVEQRYDFDDYANEFGAYQVGEEISSLIKLVSNTWFIENLNGLSFKEGTNQRGLFI